MAKATIIALAHNRIITLSYYLCSKLNIRWLKQQKQPKNQKL
jgi:hypothetical protein